MSARLLTLGDSELMTQQQDLRSFHHDSRRDKPSTDTARNTIKKISFKPPGRRSSLSGRFKTAHPAPERGTKPTAICGASAQVAQVSGTHRFQLAAA